MKQNYTEQDLSEAVVTPQDIQPGKVSHHYGTLVIAEVDPSHPAITAAEKSTATTKLDSSAKLGLAAFNLRQSDAYRTAKAARPHQGRKWDDNSIPELKPPLPASILNLKAAAPAAGTSDRLTGSVAVGIVIVSGPGDLAFSGSDTTKVVAEVQSGLSWLGAAAGGVAFHHDIQNVTLQLPDDPNGNDKEGYWRNPTMQALGYANPGAYVQHIIQQYGTDWGYCAFFVKYSQTWFAYAYIGGPYLCMQFSNDGWGPDNIDRVFAHETGHIFNAPDEYAASNCNCTQRFGVFNVVNGNCATCAPNGGVDCIMLSNAWTMCSYTPWHLGLAWPMLPMVTLWESANMGQGPGAVQWLIGDINGDGKDEIVQQWANGSSLGTIVYGWVNNTMTVLWSTADMGQGPGAVQWLIGDINGDGKAEIVQQWANGSSLGTIVYGWVNNAMTVLWSTADMGQGPGAVQWLIGDINGDGKAEIVQQWANGSSLGTIVYGWVNNAMTVLWSTGNMGQGPGAVQWLIGDINGDGKAEIIQQWANGSSLGTIVYGWVNNAMTVLWSTADMGQGPGAVHWLIGDINGDGKAEIVQQWANGSSLGTIVYGWVNNAMTVLWSSGNMGQGPGAVQWLIGKIDGGARAKVIQEWANGSSLGTIVYGQPV
jgi:hypothetical protein